jgi:hypothetical protein
MSVAGGCGRSYRSILAAVWRWMKSTFRRLFDGGTSPEIDRIDRPVRINRNNLNEH